MDVLFDDSTVHLLDYRAALAATAAYYPGFQDGKACDLARQAIQPTDTPAALRGAWQLLGVFSAARNSALRRVARTIIVEDRHSSFDSCSCSRIAGGKRCLLPSAESAKRKRAVHTSNLTSPCSLLTPHTSVSAISKRTSKLLTC